MVRALTSQMSFLCRAWEHRDNFQYWAVVPRVLLVLERCGCSLRSQLGVSREAALGRPQREPRRDHREESREEREGEAGEGRWQYGEAERALQLRGA